MHEGDVFNEKAYELMSISAKSMLMPLTSLVVGQIEREPHHV